MDFLLDFPVSSLAAPLAMAMLVAGAAIMVWPQYRRADARVDVKKRLRVDIEEAETPGAKAAARNARIRDRLLKQAREFYLKSDPENVARIRMKLIRAGYFDPNATSIYFSIRFIAFGAGLVGSLFAGASLGAGLWVAETWLMAFMVGAIAYFAPNVVLSFQTRSKLTEYRNGFPDFMDLMVVCSDAGISMEAAIERVSHEMMDSHPSLAQNLQLVSIELRAGRSLDDALRALAERLGVEEVRAFATLLQQSRELGTSLSGALRVFSDEMRHKRMARAEEKAHALPAKMSVPVTVCILPTIMLVAIIPVIVRLVSGDY